MIYDTNSRAYAAEATYDTRRYQYGPPLDAGIKGWQYRIWRDAFIARLGTYEFKDPNQASTLQDTALGYDDGGDAAPRQPAPLPLNGGGPAAARRNRRLKMLYSVIRTHVETRFGRCLRRGPPRRRAAVLILDRECDEQLTDLDLQDLLRNVRDLTILNSMGITRSTQFLSVPHDTRGVRGSVESSVRPTGKGGPSPCSNRVVRGDRSVLGL